MKPCKIISLLLIIGIILCSCLLSCSSSSLAYTLKKIHDSKINKGNKSLLSNTSEKGKNNKTDGSSGDRSAGKNRKNSNKKGKEKLPRKAKQLVVTPTSLTPTPTPSPSPSPTLTPIPSPTTTPTPSPTPTPTSTPSPTLTPTPISSPTPTPIITPPTTITTNGMSKQTIGNVGNTKGPNPTTMITNGMSKQTMGNIENTKGPIMGMTEPNQNLPQTIITKPAIIHPNNPNLPSEAPPMAMPQLPPMAKAPQSSSLITPLSQNNIAFSNMPINNQGIITKEEELSDGLRKLEQNKIRLENEKLELESLKLDVEKRKLYASLNPFMQCEFCNKPRNSCACIDDNGRGHYNNDYDRPYSTDTCPNNLYNMKIYKDTSVFKPVIRPKESILCESGTYMPAATGRPPYDSIPKNDYGVF